jgi:hypothetical protein
MPARGPNERSSTPCANPRKKIASNSPTVTAITSSGTQSRATGRSTPHSVIANCTAANVSARISVVLRFVTPTPSSRSGRWRNRVVYTTGTATPTSIPPANERNSPAVRPVPKPAKASLYRSTTAT